MPGRLIGGRYELEREIGRGGMGAIWAALDLQLQRRVAVKLMSAESTAWASSHERFEREAMTIARVQNRHVVQIFEYGLDAGAPFIVMEMLDGEDLETRLHRQKQMAPAALLKLVNQIAKALSAAHAVGVIHRDLKPANIYLARTDAEEVVKILDFGVALLSAGHTLKMRHLDDSKSNFVIGTPHYMSPEQIRGEKRIDHRSDLWSLGVLLYRALTGEMPFVGSSLGDLIVRVCSDPILPPSQLSSDLGPEVDRFFWRALARDPAQRFQSAGELATVFAALIETQGARAPAKILIVDDEPDAEMLIRQRFRKQIRTSTYQFVFATDGEKALEELRKHPDIDIAFSDINMPGMDGLTFLTRVGEVNPLIKVIMVSAYGDMGNVRRAMNSGAFDFLVKPIDFKDFEMVLEKTLQHVRELRKTIRSTEENSLLRMFVNSGIVDRLLPLVRTIDGMAGETFDATVVFVDIDGFLPLSGTEPPDTIIRHLNANFDVIVPELTARRGVVDKYLGDAVMAVFRGNFHIERALEACLAVRTQLSAAAQHAGGEPPFTHGVSIGIDSGNVLSGSIGSKTVNRLDYTVLGEVVNHAAHLQAAAASDQILISEPLQLLVRDAFQCEPIGSRLLPGRSPETLLYNVVRRLSEDISPTDETIESVRSDATLSVGPRTLRRPI